MPENPEATNEETLSMILPILSLAMEVAPTYVWSKEVMLEIKQLKGQLCRGRPPGVC